MKTKYQDINSVKSLKNGELTYIAWSEGGGGEVKLNNEIYSLYYIPQYGGMPIHVKDFQFKDIKEMVDLAHTWT